MCEVAVSAPARPPYRQRAGGTEHLYWPRKQRECGATGTPPGAGGNHRSGGGVGRDNTPFTVPTPRPSSAQLDFVPITKATQSSRKQKPGNGRLHRVPKSEDKCPC